VAKTGSLSVNWSGIAPVPLQKDASYASTTVKLAGAKPGAKGSRLDPRGLRPKLT
jgi:hypothetical protein